MSKSNELNLGVSLSNKLKLNQHIQNIGKGLEKIAPTHIHRIDNFLKNHSTERFISQLESI